MKAIVFLCFLILPAAARAGQNTSAQAWLSWSPTEQVVDIPDAPAVNLYVRFTNLQEFNGGAVDLVWTPPLDASGCFEHIGTLFKIGTDCTYLNRGQPVPITPIDTTGHYVTDWFNAGCNSSCSAGTVLVLQFSLEGCPGASGCFTLQSAAVYDCVSLRDACAIGNAICRINGGGASCAPEAALPATWGAIKALYR